jgi:hypothetical protein
MATAKKPKLTATVETTSRRKPAAKTATAAAPRTGKKTLKTKPAPEVMPGDIERLAYQLWEERGRPEGNALEDWNRAEAILMQSR